MAKQFRNGDWRSGYYRDQTWMMAMGLYDSLEFFHQLYGNTDREINPGSGGRVFNNHFSVPNINPDGTWLDLTKQKNSSVGYFTYSRTDAPFTWSGICFKVIQAE